MHDIYCCITKFYDCLENHMMNKIFVVLFISFKSFVNFFFNKHKLLILIFLKMFLIYVMSCMSSINIPFFHVKGTIGEILSDPQCKDGNAWD